MPTIDFGEHNDNAYTMGLFCAVGEYIDKNNNKIPIIRNKLLEKLHNVSSVDKTDEFHIISDDTASKSVPHHFDYLQNKIGYVVSLTDVIITLQTFQMLLL